MNNLTAYLLKSILISFIVLVLVGCASAPTQEQRQNADYGAVQSTQACVDLTEQVIKLNLKDPDSAKFNHSSCIRGYWSSVPLLGLKAEFGYFQEGSVNAKNSYGAYSGFSGYQALIKNGVVIRYCINDRDGLCIPKS